MLVTTLTKRMAEDLTEYYAELGVRVRYLHSDIDTLERIAILRDLRLGEFDVLVGINLLREGLDLPEVSLVAILDADKEGFLRAERSLIQTIGRAARNINGKVIMYADRETDSMKKAISETRRRRALQEAYNKEHGITPTTIQKAIQELAGTAQDDYVDLDKVKLPKKGKKEIPAEEIPEPHRQAQTGNVRPGRSAGVREGRRHPRPHQGSRADWRWPRACGLSPRSELAGTPSRQTFVPSVAHCMSRRECAANGFSPQKAPRPAQIAETAGRLPSPAPSSTSSASSKMSVLT